MSRRVLVVAAHPDDEVLGMGGTIARHAEAGDQITVLWTTEGSSAQYAGEPDIIERKYAEGEEALKILGVFDCIRGGLPDMRLDTVPHIEVNRVVEQAVAATGTEIMYAVYPDVNRDHQAVFESAAVASRPRPGGSIRRFLAYATPSSSEWTPVPRPTFMPTWYADITGTLERKIAAFACYRTETRDWPHPRSSRAIRTAAEACGVTVGVAAAEPFVLVRSVER